MECSTRHQILSYLEFLKKPNLSYWDFHVCYSRTSSAKTWGCAQQTSSGSSTENSFSFFFFFLWTKYKSLEKPVKTIKCRHGAVFSEFTKIKFLPPNLTSGNHQEVTWNTFVAWPLELQHCPRYNTADSAQLPEMHLHTYMHAHILHTAWGEY